QLRARQDVYALACTAFELLTGTPLYEGSVPCVMWSQVHAEPPRASARRSGLCWRIDRALSRGLAKMPEHRTPTPMQFAEELAAAVATRGQPARILLADAD